MYLFVLYYFVSSLLLLCSELKYPWDMTIDWENNFYVTDREDQNLVLQLQAIQMVFQGMV